MGRGILLVEPAAPASIVAGSQFSRMLTPNPKEAASIPGGGGSSITIDYGSDITVDSAFFGYHTASANGSWAVVKSDSSGATLSDYLVPPMPSRALGFAPPQHGFYRAPVPLTSRYWKFQFADTGPDYKIGVFALGLAFQTEYGEERGGGGLIEDTGSVERLFGGGFGIDEGVATTGYSWTFGDLQDAERRQLFQIVKRLRTTRSFLMVENPAQTEGLNERIHWGLFRKLEAYERIDPRNSKWALSLWDWA